MNKAKKSKLRSENPDPIDVHVGARLRMRRNLMGLSQEQMGKALGLTFQQIQKYERGVNRMGASRLHQLSKLLSVPINFFFEELPASAELAAQPGFADNAQSPLEDMPAAGDHDIMRRRETLELVRTYYRIQDTKQRRKIYELVRSMADK